jgi:hypothetical protein
VDAELGLEGLTDCTGLYEADQPLGEDLGLRPSGQPDGKTSGRDMVDGLPPTVGRRDAVANETFVERKVRQQAIFG